MSRRQTRAVIFLSFTFTFAIFESLLPEQTYGLRIIPQLGIEPTYYGLYPYHVYFAFPIFAVFSTALAYKPVGGIPKTIVSTILRTFMIFPLVLIAEDILFFMIQGTWISSYDWTCRLMGCSITPVVPRWYVAGVILSLGTWIMQSVLNKYIPRQEKVIAE